MVNKLEISFGTPLRVVVEGALPPAAEVWLTVQYEGFRITAKGGEIVYTLPVDHLVKMQVSYKDAAGNPAKVDGAVVWTSSDETLATVEVDPGDSTIVKVTPVGPLGQVQVTTAADADLGAGVTQLLTVADVDLVAGAAVAGTLTPLGPAEPIAPHAAHTRA